MQMCLIEEDELALMAMMGEHISYEDDWVIDSRCSNHMINDQSDTIEAGPRRRKYYQTWELVPRLEDVKSVRQTRLSTMV